MTQTNTKSKTKPKPQPGYKILSKHVKRSKQIYAVQCQTLFVHLPNK